MSGTYDKHRKAKKEKQQVGTVFANMWTLGPDGRY